MGESTYRVEIAIDVDAESPEAAAAEGWRLLTEPGAQLPVCDVIDEHGDGEIVTVDLQEMAWRKP